MKITPIGERVLIKQKEPVEQTKSGIYIPDSAQQKRKEGDVISVGTYKDGKPLPLKEGDHVIYGGYSAEKIEIDGEELVFVEYKDILARVE